jgi:hypothetical protein
MTTDIRLNQLATRGTTTAFSDWPFRSVAEVERVLASMPIPSLARTPSLRRMELAGRIKLTDSKDTTPPEERGPVMKKSKFKTAGVPGIHVGLSNDYKKLTNTLTNLHHEIQDQKEKVSALKTNALNTFKSTKYGKQVDAMLSLFDAREKELLEQELAAHQRMHDIAEQHMPDPIKSMFNKVLNPVIRGMSGMFRKAVKRYTISFIPGPLLQFQAIIELKNLKTSKGYTFKSFWLICTCIIDERSHYHFYVDTAVKQPVPNVTPVASQTRGFPFSKASDGVKLLSTHLLVDDQIDVALPTELPKSKKEIENTKFRNVKIKKVTVDEQERTITFITDPLSEQGIQKVVGDILADLTAIFETGSMHEKLKYKESRLVTGGSKITVWVGNPLPRIAKGTKGDSSSYLAGSHKLDILQHELDLSSEEVDQIRRLLRGRQPHPSEVEGNE